jgi:hypothetical protein
MKGFRARSAARIVGWAALAAACGAAALLLYVRLAGFPAWVEQRVIDDFARRGWTVAFRALEWNLREGLVVRDVRLFGSRPDVLPVLEAERLSLKPVWTPGARPAVSVIGAAARGAVLIQRLPVTAGEEAGEGDPVRVGPLRVELDEAGSAWIVEARAEQNGLSIALKGAIQRSDEGRPLRIADIIHTGLLAEQLGRIEAPSEAWGRFTEGLGGEAIGAVELSFDLGSGRPEQRRMRAIADVRDASYRGVKFRNLALEAEWRGDEVIVSRFELTAPHGALRVSGRAWMDRETAEVRVENTLPGVLLTRLLPDPARAWMDRNEIQLVGPVQGSCTAGPARWSELDSALEGGVRVRNARVRGVPVDSLRAAFRTRADIVHLPRFSASFGREAERTSIEGDARLERSAGIWSFAGRLEGHPRALAHFLTTNAAPTARAFVVRDEPMRVRGRAGGKLHPEPRVWCEGSVAASNFLFRGSAISAASADVRYTNEILTLDRLAVRRPEGEAQGRVALDFANDTVTLSAASTIDPRALSRMIGPLTEAWVANGRWEGPVRLEGEGTIDMDGGGRHDLRFRIGGEDIGFRWFTASVASAEGVLRGRTLTLAPIRAVLCGGEIRGTALFRLGAVDGHTVYEVEGSVLDTDLACAVEAVRQIDGSPYKGQLSIRGWVSGVMGDGNGRTARGQLDLTVRDGRLFQVPLFGGLSHYLSRLIPGFGFTGQTDFESTAELRDGRLVFHDASVEGNFISVTGGGSCGFDGSLDMTAQARLLRRGVFGAILRFLTFPVTKLFEFSLEGTLEEPRWRPENLPKELFLIFE